MKCFVVPGLLAAALSFAGVAAANAQEGPGRALVPSNVLKLSADTVRTSTTQFTGTDFKEFIVPYAGSVRVRWQIRSNEATRTANITVRSTINECLNSTTSTAFVTQTCDLRVVAGDRVLVSAIGSSFGLGGTQRASVSIRNVRLHFNIVDAAGTGVTVTD